MASYMNPYAGAVYPQMSYANPYAAQGYQSAMPMQQSYAAQPTIAAAWVEGEMEARGRQIPAGATQFLMIDANRQKIYWKSLNQMGMPNPMQILNFTIEGQTANLTEGQSGGMETSGTPAPDMSQFVTKQDFEALRNEIAKMNQSGASNQNGGNNGGRGGNR